MKKRQKRPKRRMNPNTVLIIRQVLIGVMIFSFIGLLVSSVWYGSRIHQFTLETVEVSGGETISHDEVRDKTWQQLEGSYLGLVPRVFAFTYPHDDIVENLETVDRIKDVKVHRKTGKVLAVTFDEYTPDALWCDSDEGVQCVFLDENGYGFSYAPNLTGGAFMRFVGVGKSPAVKSSFIALEDYEKIQKLILLLNDAGWYISRVDVDSASDMYLYVVGGGELKATLRQEPTETVNNLLTVLNSDDFEHITPGSFKYIDLRFGNKVFVNEVLESEVVEESVETLFSTTTDLEI